MRKNRMLQSRVINDIKSDSEIAGRTHGNVNVGASGTTRFSACKIHRQSFVQPAAMNECGDLFPPKRPPFHPNLFLACLAKPSRP
ncbi:hypothetical protein CEXT_561901 [Caerostris extrusa]|uniref:Uncharacterized protein n=1 Tax=Caerostris extrusa TaxID=172846 RepID=A0AAV4NK70_CAEEX|nr:hypothetical protein CEXT_561901 [Caerostris extrusa]